MIVALLLAATVAQPVPYFPNPLPEPPEAVKHAQTVHPLATTGPHILYVNFDGGQLTGNSSCSDAIHNCSFIVSGSMNYPAFSGTSVNRQRIVDLVKQYYAPFNVQVVTSRPTSGNYSMTMVGGNSIVGRGAAGVAPLDCGDSNPVDISFAFSNEVQNDTIQVAVTIAQESAHGFGLGHENEQQEIMYPALTPDMVPKSFMNQTFPIYDLGGGSSDCSGTGMQNSYQLLLQNVGAADTGPDTQPPTIDFLEPHDGDTVPSGFHIDFDATDNRGVVSVDLYVDGNKIGGTGQSPWAFDIPAGLLPKGVHKIKGVAKDAAGNAQTSTEISVTVRALGETPGDLGSACNTDADCPGGFCAFDSGANKHFCTRTCDNGANACPGGFQCVNAGGPMVCAAASGSGGGGGGCEMSGVADQGQPLAGLLLLGLGAFALVLARRRR